MTYHVGDKVECDNDVDDKKDGCGRVLAVTPQHDVRVTGGGGHRHGYTAVYTCVCSLGSGGGYEETDK